MSKGPDDVFGPEEDIPPGRVIDITPKPPLNPSESGIDFESDTPIAEQILSKGNLGAKRKDRQPSILDEKNRVVLLFSAAVAVAIFFFLIWLVSRIF